MKRRWVILVALMIVLGIAAFMSLQQSKDEEKAVTKMIEQRDQIDEIVVKKEDKTIATFKGDEAKVYVEPTPLAKIENLERSTKKKFNKKATYTITYKVSGDVLYEVDVFTLKKGEALTTEENDYSFTFEGREMMLVWQPYEERLSQHETTKQLLQQLR